MAPDSNTTIEIVALLAVSAVVLASVYLLHRSRTRLRDAHLRRDSTQSEDERAFNEIRIASAGADHLQREGFDVAPIRDVLARASSEDRQGRHSEALRLVSGARDQLVAIRTGRTVSLPAATSSHARTGARPAVTGPPAIARPSPSSGYGFRASSETLAISDAETEPEGESAPRPKLPLHQVEARFALTELGRDLAKTGLAPEARRLGEQSRRDATAAYDRAQFSDAWKIALRGRRQLGVLIEGVGGGLGARPAVGPPSGQPASAPERGPCASCGTAARGGDRFCRSCGAALDPGPCPRCGARFEPGDRFCPACGGPAAA